MPRTIRTKIYKFQELPEAGKEQAIQKWRERTEEYFWQDENRESLEAFEKVFPITISTWSYNGQGSGVSFSIHSSEIEELKGIRLATYLWNNYRDEIYSKKYLKSWVTAQPVKHRKVKSVLCSVKAGWHNPDLIGSYYNTYYSSELETYNCPLTGYCMDNELLDPMWKFLDKPDKHTDFDDLLRSCFDSWITACEKDIEWQNSDEYISEHLIANEYEFTADGRLY